MELKKTFGLSGTDIYSGYIDEDYNPIWRGQTKVDLVEEMKKSDATIAAISDGLKAPLLSVNWYIEPGSSEEKDHEIAEWVEKTLMYGEMDFKSFLEEALLFVDYGYYVFEKIWGVKDGMITLKRLAPRVPKSIERWSMGGKWENGHPDGITQYMNYTDEVRGKDVKGTTAQIPWSKIVLFTHRQTGDNFEGESIFRRAYSHWAIKQKLYKISVVAAERYGVGTPYFQVKKGLGDDVMSKYETLAKQIRSNERAGVVFTDDVIDWGIKTMDGGASMVSLMDEAIKHHDKKIYDSVLAGFLNLSSGQGGSNALSQDQSSFFIMAVGYIAKKFIAVMDEVIKEMVFMNFGEQEYYPTLCHGELQEKSIKEITDGLAVAVSNGMIAWGDLDERKIREMYDLAEREDVVVADAQKEEPEEEPTPEEKAAEEEADAIEEKTEPEEAKEMSLADIPKVPAYERSFVKAISDFENYLESEYANFDKLAAEAEGKYREIMKKAIEKADKTRKDGVMVILASKENTRLLKEASKQIDAVTARLEKKWVNSPMSKRLFTKTTQMALGAFDAFSMELSDIDPVKLEGMVRGYNSNIMAVLANDPRRVKEQLDLILTTDAQEAIALQAVSDMTIFNRNTLKLSVQAHPRGEFTSVIYDKAQQEGFTFFKVLAPTQRLKDISPEGITAGILFSVMTVAAINAYASKETDGKNPSAVQGLGLHHNSYVYYMPVPSDELEEQETLAKKQREEMELGQTAK